MTVSEAVSKLSGEDDQRPMVDAYVVDDHGVVHRRPSWWCSSDEVREHWGGDGRWWYPCRRLVSAPGRLCRDQAPQALTCLTCIVTASTGQPGGP